VEFPNRHILIASLPAALIGITSLGTDRILTHWLPLLGLALVVSRLWAELFARRRGRPLDAGWLVAAWLFALLVPAATPLGLAVVALSFGLVFGCHAFGGSGHYLVNPALLGVIFLAIGYPLDAAAPEIDSGLAVASLIGAVYLIAMRTASAQLLTGALAAVVTGAIVAGLPWHSHLTLGHFAFVLAFVATDPTVQPTTAFGRWAFGASFGALTVVLRTFDPAQPEGSLPALLLVSLCVPMLDRIARRLRTRTARTVPGGDA